MRGEHVDALAIVTHTCDIVRNPARRPYLQVARVIDLVASSSLRTLRRGSTPGRVWLPGFGVTAFADLDTIATILKDVLLAPGVTIQPGARTTEEYAAIGHQIGRCFSRFAFPDEVTRTLDPLRRRLVSKANGQGDEGRVLAKVTEIRAGANPGWDATGYEIDLTFIFEPGLFGVAVAPEDLSTVPTGSPPEVAKALITGPTPWPLNSAQALLDEWVALCEVVDPVTAVRAEAVSAEEFTMIEYWRTVRLDLDEVSWPDQ